MKKKQDESCQNLYPKLPDSADFSIHNEDSEEEDGGEEIIISRRSSPLAADLRIQETYFKDTSKSRRSSALSHSPTEETYHKEARQKSSIPIPFIFIAFLLIPACAWIYFSYFGKDNSITSKKEWKSIVNKLLPHLMEKRDKFPSQTEDIWFQISSGLQGLSNDPKKPAVYLLTYDENSMHPSSCIVEIITTAANSFILGKHGWSFLNGSLLIESRIKDHGELIEKIANTLEKHKIIVITDVQHIPAKLAQGFHFLVDEYNPRIREAVYVLTLKIPSHLKSIRPVEAAEDTLRECWKELSTDLLQPLITRVTNQVLPVMAENSEISCPLITSVTTEIHIS